MEEVQAVGVGPPRQPKLLPEQAQASSREVALDEADIRTLGRQAPCMVGLEEDDVIVRRVVSRQGSDEVEDVVAGSSALERHGSGVNADSQGPSGLGRPRENRRPPRASLELA